MSLLNPLLKAFQMENMFATAAEFCDLFVVVRIEVSHAYRAFSDVGVLGWIIRPRITLEISTYTWKSCKLFSSGLHLLCAASANCAHHNHDEYNHEQSNEDKSIDSDPSLPHQIVVHCVPGLSDFSFDII